MEGNPLTTEGIAQAERVADQLKNENIGLVVSSDLERCKMTAEIIAEKTGAKIIFDKRLRERGLGIAEGMARGERERIYGDIMKDYENKIPGGESWQELEKRLSEVLVDHLKDHEHKNIVVVSHGAPINFLVGKMKNIQSREIISQPIPKNSEVLELIITEPCRKCSGHFYEQDPDTFDTWFSSAMWTFSTLGWPAFAETATAGKPGPENDLANYHPTSLMAPGYEILFLWVARMILMSGCLLGEIPFRRVVLHGIVRDAQGKKFSKSAGNGIDPLFLADKYGADAIRMALIVGTATGNDVKFDENRVKGYRNFSTKLWNIARFVLSNKPADLRRHERGLTQTTNAEHKQNIEELENIKKSITEHIEAFEFHLAAEKIYHYIWHTLADKIIEAEKKNLKDGDASQKAESYALLEHLLLESLKMLHPFMPFVTEEIYRKFRPDRLLMVEKW